MLHFFQESSISSSVLFLVSGSHLIATNITGEQSRANNQNVKAGPNLSSNNGTSCPTMALASHKDNVTMERALPLILVGYISDKTTQTTGPKEKAKQDINSNIGRSTAIPVVIPI